MKLQQFNSSNCIIYTNEKIIIITREIVNMLILKESCEKILSNIIVNTLYEMTINILYKMLITEAIIEICIFCIVSFFIVSSSFIQKGREIREPNRFHF